jgi:hypothetical protein
MNHLLNNMLEKISTDTLSQLSHQIDINFRVVTYREQKVDESTLLPLYHILLTQTFRKYRNGYWRDDEGHTFGDAFKEELSYELLKRKLRNN